MDSYPWDTADIIAVFRVIFIIHASVYIYSQRRRLTSYPWDNADIIINLPDHLSCNSKCIHIVTKYDLVKHATVWTLLRSEWSYPSFISHCLKFSGLAVVNRRYIIHCSAPAPIDTLFKV